MTDTLSSYLSARASMNEYRDKLIVEYHEHQAAASEIARVLKSDFGMKTIPKRAAKKRPRKRASSTKVEKPPTQVDAKKIGRLQNLLIKAKDELSRTAEEVKSAHRQDLRIRRRTAACEGGWVTPSTPAELHVVSATFPCCR